MRFIYCNPRLQPFSDVKSEEGQTATISIWPPLMDAERVLGLFDSLWFEREIFKKQPFPSNYQHPERENQEKPLKSPEAFSRVTSIHTWSMSEDLSCKLSFISTSNSPDSGLFSPKLHTILSSKDIAGGITESSENNPKERPQQELAPKKKIRVRGRGRGRGRRQGCESKSLSELEFEELKGFMDLGFVFSEEDRDSSLASIIPGLNRLGRRDDAEDEPSVDKSEISRPYLSEAWEALERENEEKPLMNWRFPALSNEIDMKDNLRWWAHTVASTVR